MDLCQGINNEKVESLWERIKGHTNVDDSTVSVCYRPTDREEEIDEAFHR